jgi:hypothetical protein
VAEANLLAKPSYSGKIKVAIKSIVKLITKSYQLILIMDIRSILKLLLST